MGQAIVGQCPAAISYATPELKADREFVLEAVSRSGFAIVHASAELRRDKEVALLALRTTGGRAIATSIAPELRNDPEIAAAAMAANGSSALMDKNFRERYVEGDVRALVVQKT